MTSFGQVSEESSLALGANTLVGFVGSTADDFYRERNWLPLFINRCLGRTASKPSERKTLRSLEMVEAKNVP
jgi:hypothetical protein